MQKGFFGTVVSLDPTLSSSVPCFNSAVTHAIAFRIMSAQIPHPIPENSSLRVTHRNNETLDGSLTETVIRPGHCSRHEELELEAQADSDTCRVVIVRGSNGLGDIDPNLLFVCIFEVAD